MNGLAILVSWWSPGIGTLFIGQWILTPQLPYFWATIYYKIYNTPPHPPLMQNHFLADPNHQISLSGGAPLPPLRWCMTSLMKRPLVSSFVRFLITSNSRIFHFKCFKRSSLKIENQPTVKLANNCLFRKFDKWTLVILIWVFRSST